MQDLTQIIDTNTGEPAGDAVVRAMLYRRLGTVTVGARMRVVDMLRTPIDVVPAPAWWNRRTMGVWDQSDISPFVLTDAAVTNNDARTTPVHRQISFTFLDPTSLPLQQRRQLPTTLDPVTGTEGLPYNPNQNLLDVSFTMSAGPYSLEFPMGLYQLVDPMETQTEGARTMAWSGADLMVYVEDNPFISDWVCPALYVGGSMQAAIDMATSAATMASLGGLGMTPVGLDDAGPAVPLSMIPYGTNLFPNSGNLPVDNDVLYQAGSSRVAAMNDRADACAYFPFGWIHRPAGDGLTRLAYLVTRPQPVLSSGPPGWGFDLSTVPNLSILEPGAQRQFQGLVDPAVANVIRGVSTPATSSTSAVQPLSSTFVNTGLDSNGQITSLIGTQVMRGLDGGPRSLPRYISNSNVTQQASLDLYVQLAAQEGASKSDQLTVTCMHMPILEDYDTVICQLTNADGTVMVTSNATSPYRVDSWTLPLLAENGRSAITLTRYVGV